MKNLYQKLSKENQQKILINGKFYPTTISILLDSLRNKTSWSLMTMSDALTLWNAVSEKPFDFEKFTNLFENE